MRPTVETASLVREIHLAFASWTVPAMTTAEQAPSAPRPALRALEPPQRQAGNHRLLSAAAVAAALLGTQTLAASVPLASDVRLLLPSEGLLAGLGDGLRRGYGLAMEQSAICGVTPPSLQIGWLAPGADPAPALRAATRSALLVAPPAAPLEPYGVLADQQRLTVLLPLQRGRSLEGLPQLRGSDRLWPLVPGRSLEVDRLAQALLADGIKKVMVVRDRTAESQALSDRFEATYANGSGQVIGLSAAPVAVDGDDPATMKQLVGDVDWYRPPALVVITAPGSRLEQAIRRAPWPETTLLAWPFPVTAAMAQRQIGVDPLSRGPGWSAFARSFERRWGYRPGPVEGAGYDTGLMAALASVRAQGQAGWALDWFSANANPQPLCRALRLRAQGRAVRPMGASSRLDLSPGVPPTANLQLSRR